MQGVIKAYDPTTGDGVILCYTDAGQMEDQVPEDVKHERLERLVERIHHGNDEVKKAAKLELAPATIDVGAVVGACGGRVFEDVLAALSRGVETERSEP